MIYPRRAYFGYLRVCHYALSFAPTQHFPKLTPFECIVLAGPSQKGLISDIYELLNDYSITTQGKHRYMLKWEQALGEELPLEAWWVIWSQAKSKICTLNKENTNKILFFWYLTPSHLQAIYPAASTAASDAVDVEAPCCISTGSVRCYNHIGG